MNLIGQKFSKLTVIGEAENGRFACGKSYRRVKVRCVCGTERIVDRVRLLNGKRKSCGSCPIELELRERFSKHLSAVTESGCILWTGTRHLTHGYGQFRLHQKPFQTHRVAWMLKHGAIPSGMCVCHRCDNPPCVNVEHLFLGTLGDNNRDCATKGRTARGSKNGQTKLTAEQVREIRERRALGETIVALGDEFGVGNMQISRIARGERWGWLK